MSLCSPSGRASSVNSTCRASHCCLPAGWILSESIGGEPSITWLTMPRTLQAIPTRRFHIFSTSPNQASKLTFDLILPVPVVDDLTASPAGGNSTGLKCCPLASEVFMTGMLWWSCASKPAYIYRNTATLFLSVRPWMGQLGDPPSEPHHPHLCPLRPTRKCRPVSIIPVQHPGRQLTGRIPAKIKQNGSYVTHYM